MAPRGGAATRPRYSQAAPARPKFALRAELRASAGPRPYFFGRRWTKGRWALDATARELVRFADEADEADSRYAFPSDCAVQASKENTKVVELTKVGLPARDTSRFGRGRWSDSWWPHGISARQPRRRREVPTNFHVAVSGRFSW